MDLAHGRAPLERGHGFQMEEVQWEDMKMNLKRENRGVGRGRGHLGLRTQR
jgi:hypothetical protein